MKCSFASGGVRTHAAFAKGSPSQSVGLFSLSGQQSLRDWFLKSFSLDQLGH
jgi:hypothetical protein